MHHYEVRDIEDLATWLKMDWLEFQQKYNDFYPKSEIIYDGDDVCLFISDGDDGFAIASHSSDIYPEDGFTLRVVSGYIELPYEELKIMLDALGCEGRVLADKLAAEELGEIQ